MYPAEQPLAKLEARDRSYLRKYLTERFDLEELKSLAYDIGVQYQQLPHTNSGEFSRELLAYCERDGKLLLDLVGEAEKLRHDSEVAALRERLAAPAVPPPASSSPLVPTKTARIFISYKRNSEPDEGLALEVFRVLSQQHQVFIDRTMLVGTPWVEQIKTELQLADFMISFLSANSVHSEMMMGELANANELQRQNGHPLILPVRLNFQEPFQYPLNVYLNHINWTLWQGQADTPRLLDELQRAIASNTTLPQSQTVLSIMQPELAPEAIPQPLPSAQPRALELPEGTMDVQSDFYIERASDAIALEAIKRQGVTIPIKGPRQMGKSSLLLRTTSAAAAAGKRVAFLDFQLFDKAALHDADTFYQQFCAWLTDELEMDSRVDEYWKMPLSNSLRCTRYLQRYLLKEISGPLVLAMDEVESIFDTPFRTDFFSMLRSWHNSRQPGTVWKKLDLVLVTSTEPYQLISDLNQSPFNVGEVVELGDFTSEQVHQLNGLHGTPLSPPDERRLYDLLGGHPYLVRRALYLIASGRMAAAELFANATTDRGPFGDHLRYHLFRLNNQTKLVQALRQVLRNQTLADEELFFGLRGAGLVRREGKTVLPRCQLYAQYFQEHLNG